jgi:hypothetical protein
LGHQLRVDITGPLLAVKRSAIGDKRALSLVPWGVPPPVVIGLDLHTCLAPIYVAVEQRILEAPPRRKVLASVEIGET